MMIAEAFFQQSVMGQNNIGFWNTVIKIGIKSQLAKFG